MEYRQCINYLLTTAQHRVFQIFSNRLAPFDLTPVQYGVLNCIWETDVSSPKQIAEMLMLENSTISGVLDRMEKKMLIVRNISLQDRRHIQIELTERSKKLKEEVTEVVDEFNREIFSTMSKEEEIVLKELLKKLSLFE